MAAVSLSGTPVWWILKSVAIVPVSTGLFCGIWGT